MKRIVNFRRDRFNDHLTYTIAAAMLLMAVILLLKYKFGNNKPSLFLPHNITTAIDNRFPNATILNADPTKYYLVKLQIGKTQKEINVSTNGVIYDANKMEHIPR